MFDASPSWSRAGQSTPINKGPARKPLTSPVNRMKPPTQPRMTMPPPAPMGGQPPMGITMGGGPSMPPPMPGPMNVGPSMPLGNPGMGGPMIGGPAMGGGGGQLPGGGGFLDTGAGMAQLLQKLQGPQGNTGINGMPPGGMELGQAPPQDLWSAYNNLSSGNPMAKRGLVF